MTAPARLAARGRGARRRSRRDAAASSDMRLLPRARRQPKWAGHSARVSGFRFPVSHRYPDFIVGAPITGGTET